MVMYAAKHADGATREDARAAAANQLLGVCIALDPKGYRGLDELVHTLWRHPKAETQDTQAPPPQPRGPGAEAAGMVPAANGLTAAASAVVADQLRDATVELGMIRAALKPFVDLCRALQPFGDEEFVSFKEIPGTEPTRYADIEARHVRALIKAAGLWTDDMLPRSDDDTGAKAGQDASADAPVRASASVEDASHAGSSVADHPDTTRAAPTQAVEPSATPAAGDLPPADADLDEEVDF